MEYVDKGDGMLARGLAVPRESFINNDWPRSL